MQALETIGHYALFVALLLFILFGVYVLAKFVVWLVDCLRPLGRVYRKMERSPKTAGTAQAHKVLDHIDSEIRALLACEKIEIAPPLTLEFIIVYERTRSLVLRFGNPTIDSPKGLFSPVKAVQEEGARLIFGANLVGEIDCFVQPAKSEMRTFKQAYIYFCRFRPNVFPTTRQIRRIVRDFMDIGAHTSSYLGSTSWQKRKYEYLAARSAIKQRVAATVLRELLAKLAP